MSNPNDLVLDIAQWRSPDSGLFIVPMFRRRGDKLPADQEIKRVLAKQNAEAAHDLRKWFHINTKLLITSFPVPKLEDL